MSRKTPAEVGPWGFDYRTSRYWFSGSEAARAFHAGDGEQPWEWCVWGRSAQVDATSSGRAATKELAQAAADKALQDEGIVLVRPVRAD